MIVLKKGQKDQLMTFIPGIRITMADWKLVEFRLSEEAIAQGYPISSAIEQIYQLFKEKDGVIYTCNDHELLILVRVGAKTTYQAVAKEVTDTLPENTCEVFVHSTDKEFGLQKLEFVLITSPLANKKRTVYIENPANFTERKAREDIVVCVADDDMFIRKMVLKALEGLCGKAIEIDNGADVIEKYHATNPDVLFLDIHMPGMDGKKALHEILERDPHAYIVMLSSDTATDQVVSCLQDGAKGFIEKPASKEKLEEYIQKCPSVAA